MGRLSIALTLLAAMLASVRADNTANPGAQFLPGIDLMMDFNLRPKAEETRQTMDEGPMEKVMYTGDQVWKVCSKEPAAQLGLTSLIRNADIMAWGGNYTCTDFVVKSSSFKAVKEMFELTKIDYQVLIEDLQKAIDEENPPPDTLELDNRQGHRMTWQSYHRLNDIHGYLDYLAETYPQLCSVRTIGQSAQGRPIKLLKISNGKRGNKAVWIDGGMHAREWISPATATFIINKIVTENDPKLDSVDWYILPVANPDGYEYSHNVDRLWRKNRRGYGYCAGIDLNRNFGYKWGGKGSTSTPCIETYRGTSPFSELETQAIRNFMTANGINWKVYISLHSYGQYILYPWGYDKVLAADNDDLNRAGQKAVEAIRRSGGPQYSLGSSATLLYPASGGSDDWAKGSLGIKYSYTIELRDNGRHGFILPASYIKQTGTETFMAVSAIVSHAIS